MQCHAFSRCNVSVLESSVFAVNPKSWALDGVFSYPLRVDRSPISKKVAFSNEIRVNWPEFSWKIRISGLGLMRIRDHRDSCTLLEII